MSKLNYILLLFMSLGLLSFQDKVDSAAVQLERNQLKIGEQTILKLQFYHNVVDQEVIWPEFDNFLTNDIEIIEKGEITTVPLDTLSAYKFLKQQEFIITAFEPKKLPIPPFEFGHLDSIYLSQPTNLMVSTVQVDTAQSIYDIYPIYEVDYPLPERIADTVKAYWHIVVILLLIGLMVYFLYKYMNKPKPVVKKPKVIIPPHVKALKVLNELKQQEAWKNENKKQYYSNLTDTVRAYLEDRFGIQALEKTTREIINDLKYSNISVDDKHFLREILKQADFVKFAKFKPGDDDGFNALNKSFEFVERTKPSQSNSNNNNDVE